MYVLKLINIEMVFVFVYTVNNKKHFVFIVGIENKYEE